LKKEFDVFNLYPKKSFISATLVFESSTSFYIKSPVSFDVFFIVSNILSTPSYLAVIILSVISSSFPKKMIFSIPNIITF